MCLTFFLSVFGSLLFVVFFFFSLMFWGHQCSTAHCSEGSRDTDTDVFYTESQGVGPETL